MRWLSRNKRRFLSVLLLSAFLVSVQLQPAQAFGPVIVQLLRVAVQTFLIEAAKTGLDQAGKNIFRDSWTYAQKPVLAVVGEVGKVLPKLLDKNAPAPERVREAEEAEKLVSADPYLEELIVLRFGELEEKELNQILLTLTFTMNAKLDQALRNQAVLLRNQLKSLENDQSILEALRNMNFRVPVIAEGLSHFIDPNDVFGEFPVSVRDCG